MKRMIIAVVIVSVFVFAFSAVVLAQEEGIVEPYEEEVIEETEFSFGVVETVGEQMLSIKEYDIDTGEEVSVKFSVNSETVLENINAITDLKAEDEVSVEYKIVDGKMLAVYIFKEEPMELMEEEETWEMEEGEIPAIEADIPTTEEEMPIMEEEILETEDEMPVTEDEIIEEETTPLVEE